MSDTGADAPLAPEYRARRAIVGLHVTRKCHPTTRVTYGARYRVLIVHGGGDSRALAEIVGNRPFSQHRNWWREWESQPHRQASTQPWSVAAFPYDSL